MREQGITPRERDEAVAYMTGSFPVSLETNAGLANVLWEMEFYGLGDDYLDRHGELYRAVTVEAANAAARKYLHPDRAVTVIVGTLPE
jgi:zinc protease